GCEGRIPFREPAFALLEPTHSGGHCGFAAAELGLTGSQRPLAVFELGRAALGLRAVRGGDLRREHVARRLLRAACTFRRGVDVEPHDGRAVRRVAAWTPPARAWPVRMLALHAL